MMHYKGYVGKVIFDDDADIFHGEVINTKDVITFQGKSVRELHKAFKDSIEDYFEFCKERGEDPEKPFSGKFPVRATPEEHRLFVIAAANENKSLNNWVRTTLKKAAGN